MKDCVRLLISGMLICTLFAADPLEDRIRLGSRDNSRAINPKAQSLVLFQQHANEGYYKDDVNLEDADAYFRHIFSQLPVEVTVYPSENYFYFIDHIGGRQFWGNIRLSAGWRERGIVGFSYAEFQEFPSEGKVVLSRTKHLTATDGLKVKSKDPFTWVVTYHKKSVIFHLHKLSIEPPRSFALKTNEAFIERTFDESGIQFFLMFNTAGNYFFWVLNEEEIVPDEFVRLEKDILVGRRTGFAFWIDSERRKVLASVRNASVTRNDYYDGPFDQLADNYVDHNKISEWIERAVPSARGRIDKYGYYKDSERPTRVGLSCYGNYETHAEVVDFVKKAKAASDPYRFISRGGD